MAKAADQFRASDVTVWGVVTLVIWGIAVFGSNLSLLVPESFFAGLHSSRLAGASINQVRSQVAALEQEAQRMKRENALLVQRFSLSEQSGGDLTRRIGALESSVPKLLEALPPSADIDRSAVTASITPGQTLTYDVDGGAVSVTQRPIPAPETAVQAMPAMPSQADMGPVQPDSNAFGVALGAPFDAEDAQTQWQSISNQVGPLLLGLGPLLGDLEGTVGKRIVAGPISERSDAEALCGRMSKIGIACQTVPFIGTPL